MPGSCNCTCFNCSLAGSSSDADDDGGGHAGQRPLRVRAVVGSFIAALCCCTLTPPAVVKVKSRLLSTQPQDAEERVQEEPEADGPKSREDIVTTAAGVIPPFCNCIWISVSRHQTDGTALNAVAVAARLVMLALYRSSNTWRECNSCSGPFEAVAGINRIFAVVPVVGTQHRGLLPVIAAALHAAAPQLS